MIEYPHHYCPVEPTLPRLQGLTKVPKRTGVERLPKRYSAITEILGRWALAQATHLSSSQAFSSSYLLKRSHGVKKRSRTRPTWFSTCPFSQPDAGVQATGWTR